MSEPQAISDVLSRLEERLAHMEQKIDAISQTRTKSFEWIAQLSEHVSSLDDFREEVRASLEPLFYKLENLDEIIRILRHATSDVSRRVERLEPTRKVG